MNGCTIIEDLYKPWENPAFDDPFKTTVCDIVRRLIHGTDETENNVISISREEIESALKLSHKGKACGDDGIYYEHIFLPLLGLNCLKSYQNYFQRR